MTQRLNTLKRKWKIKNIQNNSWIHERCRTSNKDQSYYSSHITWLHYNTPNSTTCSRDTWYSTVSLPLDCFESPFWHFYMTPKRSIFVWRRVPRFPKFLYWRTVQGPRIIKQSHFYDSDTVVDVNFSGGVILHLDYEGSIKDSRQKTCPVSPLNLLLPYQQ